jgi:hypothetical protein
MGSGLSTSYIPFEHENLRTMLYNATKQNDIYAFHHYYNLIKDKEENLDYINWIFHNALLNKSTSILEYFATNNIINFIPLTQQLFEYLDFYPDCNIVYWLLEHGAVVNDSVSEKLSSCFDNDIFEKLFELQQKQKNEPVQENENVVQKQEKEPVQENENVVQKQENENKQENVLQKENNVKQELQQEETLVIPKRTDSVSNDNIDIPVYINQDFIMVSEF